MTTTTPHTYRVGDRVRFVPVQEQRGDVARPDHVTAAYVGSVVKVLAHLDRTSYLIEFDAPPVQGIRSRRATYPAESLEPWPPR